MKISAVVHNALVAGLEQLKLKAGLDFNPIKSAIELGTFIQSLGLTDSANTLEELSLAYFKSLSDDSSAVDSANLAFLKSITDSGYASEDVVFTFIKSLADSFGTTDDATLYPTKGVSDASATADSITAVVDKYLTDSVFGTDDLDGEASTEDDQEIHFHKVRAEAAFIGDVFSRVVQYYRSFSDASVTNDATANTVFKVLADVVTTSDSLGAELIVNEYAVDTSGVSEILYLILTKVLNEAPLAHEELSLYASKSSVDTYTALDATALLLAVVKSDSGATSDNTVKLTIKSLSDSGDASDAGSYRGQGYSDFDYFAEDYVGYSGVF